MSLISDALRKTNRTQTSNTPTPPRTGWIYGVVALGIAGLILIVMAQSRTAIAPPTLEGSRSFVRSNESPAFPAGLNLLRTAEGQWRLNGTVRGTDGHALALINGHVVEEGETIGGARIVRVSHDQVQIENGGQINTVRME